MMAQAMTGCMWAAGLHAGPLVSLRPTVQRHAFTLSCSSKPLTNVFDI